MKNNVDEEFRELNKKDLKGTFRKYRSKIYRLLPKNFSRPIKYFYQDRIAFPLNCFSNKKYYGYYDFFNVVGIETTTHCNLRCKFCPNSVYDRGLKKNTKLMPIETYKKIIDELSELDYRGKILPFFFGDPLTDNRIVELVKYTRDKVPKATIHLNSNGYLLSVELYKKLVDAGIDSLRISQYTNEIPKPVKEVLEYLKTRPKNENKITYRIFSEKLALSNRGGKVNTTFQWDKPICTYPWTEINIDHDGNLVACCTDYHSTIKFGNVKKDNLLDIWNSPSYKKMRKDLRNYKFNHPMCKKCVGLDK
jgi:radical SAM protein with 4Fe4S-binding SPASM domain